MFDKRDLVVSEATIQEALERWIVAPDRKIVKMRWNTKKLANKAVNLDKVEAYIGPVVLEVVTKPR